MTPYYKKLLPIFLVSIFFLSSCGIYKKTDARKVPTNANERIKKNKLTKFDKIISYDNSHKRKIS